MKKKWTNIQRHTTFNVLCGTFCLAIQRKRLKSCFEAFPIRWKMSIFWVSTKLHERWILEKCCQIPYDLYPMSFYSTESEWTRKGTFMQIGIDIVRMRRGRVNYYLCFWSSFFFFHLKQMPIYYLYVFLVHFWTRCVFGWLQMQQLLALSQIAIRCRIVLMRSSKESTKCPKINSNCKCWTASVAIF